MKKLILLLLLTISCTSIAKAIDSEQYDELKPRWELYPTDNMWTFLKLDTQLGIIYVLQYDVKKDDRFEWPLNLTYMIKLYEDKKVNGRFKLYPTQNMYTFILLDQINGKTWQIQWSTKPENNLVLPIKG